MHSAAKEAATKTHSPCHFGFGPEASFGLAAAVVKYRRPTFLQRLSAIGKTVREVLADYIEIVELVEPLEVPQVVRDPDDNHVLACALAAKAEIVVSGDKDLLDLAQYQDIPILPAATALQRLEPNRAS